MPSHADPVSAILLLDWWTQTHYVLLAQVSPSNSVSPWTEHKQREMIGKAICHRVENRKERDILPLLIKENLPICIKNTQGKTRDLRIY